MPKCLFVYIMASVSGTLYIGITNDLNRRVWEHKNGLVEGFTKRYTVTKLVYFESIAPPAYAIAREKQLKKWRREKKISLIEQQNPSFDDLAAEWFG